MDAAPTDGFATLISQIAHELRSPLTSVKGFSATLIKRWDRFTDDQRFQFVQSIHADAERMARIVSEVLDLARLESGQLELRSMVVDVADIASKAVAAVATLPGAERVRVSVDEAIEVRVDPERFRHVLTNLVENAIKFSDAGPIDVTARSDGGAVEVSVTDRGVGIEPERLGALFSSPAPPGGMARPSGAGLGLYLARALVEAHGGRIEVESAPGEGSTFTVRLEAAP